MHDASDFEITDARDVDPAELLDVLSQGYGRPFTRAWFDWKHGGSPWGASRPAVARDSDGLLGVVFGLPWRYRVDGEIVTGIRLVDGATTPRATRRGVFGRIVRELLAPSDGTPRPEIVIATATPAAQAAHVKNGAVALEPVRFYLTPPRYSTASAVTTSEPDRQPTENGDQSVETAWDLAATQWRCDHRTGAEYRTSSLTHADERNGMIYTVSDGRVRVLRCAAVWGSARDQRRLIGSVARQTRSVGVLRPGGPGTRWARPTAGVERGQSLLCVWDQRSSGGPIGRRSDWSLTGLDLEGFI